MPTGDVTTTHVSGGLGNTGSKPDRVHLKIGIAEGSEENKTILVLNYQQAKQVFEAGPLLDSLQQYFEEFNEALNQKPAPVLCVRPKNDIPGLVEALPDTTRIGKAQVAVEGNPTGSALVIIRIVSGELRKRQRIKSQLMGALAGEL